MSRAPLCLVLGVALFSGALFPWQAVAQAQGAGKFALLVGCTEYPQHRGVRALTGPANDVALWARTLADSKTFAFPAQNVQQLVGWPDDPAKRPTYANIRKGFEKLIAQSQPGTQLVILLSGHGLQVPVPDTDKHKLDPGNPAFEADGLDEVFLPADVAQWEKTGLQNALVDDQIGQWLEQMRDRGAAVWIIFDCCHSGTMTRGQDNREVSRVADPTLFGITPQLLEQSILRARAAVKQAGGKQAAEAPLKIQPGKAAAGSVVAFYAAQPFEEAPELPLPDDAPPIPRNYYGLLSYTILQALEQRRTPINYRELARVVNAHYRGTRGIRPPNPFAEGDLDREVLGLNVWPRRADIFLDRFKGQFRINVGALFGLTKGSVLAVKPPPGAVDPAKVLGHVQVVDVSALSATVEPCAFEGSKAIASEKVPELARCSIVSRDFGDLKVKLFVAGSPGLKAALGRMNPEVKAMLALVAHEAEAEWVLRAVTPEQADREFEIKDLKGDQIFLLAGQGRQRLPREEKLNAERLRTTGQTSVRKVFGRYPLTDAVTLVGGLERDLPKLFRWQNVWRIANGVHALDQTETYGLKFEVAKLKNASDRSGGQMLRDGVLTDGQEMEFRLRNEGNSDLWVTILYLDANLGIEQYFADSIPQRGSLQPLRTRMTVAGDSYGAEGMVVLAIPMSVQREQPSFKFLEQTPLQVAARRRVVTRAPRTPFERLLHAGAFNERGSRGMVLDVPTTPAILSQSWILLPPGQR